MVVNEGFQVNEYFDPRDAFEKAGFAVKTASRYGGEVRPGRNYPSHPAILADYRFEEVRVSEFDAITFTGGGGAWSDYFPVPSLHALLRDALKERRILIGMICAATGLLATFDNLNGRTPRFKGRHVTGYRDVEGILRALGRVRYDAGDPSRPHVVVDRNLVTARDPSSSKLFGTTIVNLFKGENLRGH